MAERDWQTDWDMISEIFPLPTYSDGTLRPDYFIRVRNVREALRYWLERAKELQEENRRLREALERIAGHELGLINTLHGCGRQEVCWECEEMNDIANQALAALNDKEKEG